MATVALTVPQMDERTVAMLVRLLMVYKRQVKIHLKLFAV